MDALQERINSTCAKNAHKEAINMAGMLCPAYVWIDVASGRAVVMRQDMKAGVAMSVEDTAKLLKLKVE